MKKFLFATLITMLGLNLSIHAQAIKPYMTKTFDNIDIRDVIAQTEGGSISVTGANDRSTRVEVFIANTGQNISKQEIAENLGKNYKLTIGVENNELHVLLHRNTADLSSGQHLIVSYKIYVPQVVNTNLVTSGGDIQLTNISGKENLVTSVGSLIIDHVSGIIKGSTSRGSILIRNSGNDINVSTTLGSVRAVNCKGKIDLSDSGGTITFENLDGHVNIGNSSGSIIGRDIRGELVASTVNGSIDLSQTESAVTASVTSGNLYTQVKDLTGKMKLITNGGDMHITLPKTSNADIDVSGDIVNAKGVQNFEGTKDPARFSGKINNGGIQVVGYSSNGRVELTTL